MNTDVHAEVVGEAGLITLNRPRALNALSLGMIRALAATLLAWRSDRRVRLVAIRGTGKEGPFGAFCAGGDIRFFHQVAQTGDPRLEDFFTEEYTLNHLIHTYPKPYVACLDGIVMGGGMGISGHGGGNSLRIVTERTKMAMPETNIGLFPDVGGGWFLARCPGRVGEYLALTGQLFGGAGACAAGLADGVMASAELPALWERLGREGLGALEALRGALRSSTPCEDHEIAPHRAQIDRFFALPSVGAIVAALEADPSPWAGRTAADLRKRSPLMLHVTLEQLRRARAMTLGQDLRMERDLVRHCFHLREKSETLEGIRALAVDKDHAPQWDPVRIEDVTPAMVEAFFASPWPAHAHPLRDL